MDRLPEFRKSLNDIDRKIVSLLGERYALCRDIGLYKKENGIPMMQPSRVEEVKARCASLAAEHGVNPDFVRSLYGLIIDEACRLEDEIIDGAPGSA